MNRIDFSNKDIMEFLNNVDVISVESKALKKYLSTKIPYKKIEYIPNSYLNYSNDSNINYKDKENIIITVGRIGTVQKNNEVLLEAFSLIAEKIPDWKLKLIGDIDANFNKYIDAYFYRNPNLINRVIFMGNIESKEDLFEEYKKVKIFTLTSIREGLPNVYSEAALNGNYIITSNIDACMDMTNNLKYYTNEVKNSLMDLMFEIMEDREESEIFRNDLLNNTRIWYDAIEIEFSGLI